MDVFEITGFRTGVARDGVNFLEPGDSFQTLEDGFIYRQILQSRRGIGFFANRLSGQTRVLGIFEHILPDTTKQTLAFDTNFLYKYNTVTGVFDQIPFDVVSMAGYAGFDILSKDRYISGISYPDKNNNPRFVFCCLGINPNANGSAIFFFDGTVVKDYTNIVDNPDYQNPVIGAFTVLTKAKYVTFFNGRLNFAIPTISGKVFPQGILYSAIKDSEGNGDKFNSPGAGLLELDTSDFITGVIINGQFLNVKANRSDWVLEKTADAFNPYYSRKVYGVLGTNADFSSVVWDDHVKSAGKTGFLTSDGRNSLRIDDKIPNFSREDIAQKDFNLTYGGFDRKNNQILWSYLDSGSSNTTQSNVLAYNYHESTWSVYSYRVSVFGQTDVGIDLTWNQIDETIDKSWLKWNTTEDIWDEIGLGEAVQKTLAGDDLGFIYELDVDNDDNFAVITGILAVANLAQINVSVPGIIVGDKVVISNVVGMTEINNFDPQAETDPNFEPYIVLAIGAGTITINIDPTLFTPYISGGNVSKVISFVAKTIPFNPYRDLGKKCIISHVDFLIDTNGGYLKVDVYADEETSPYKKDILLLPDSSSVRSRQWLSMSISNEADFHTFVLKQESPSFQVKITSIRLYCSMGGSTSG